MRTIQFKGVKKNGTEVFIGDLNHINGGLFIFSDDRNSPDHYEVDPLTVTIISKDKTEGITSSELKESSLQDGRETLAKFMGAVPLDKTNLAGDTMWKFPYPVPTENNMVRQNEFELGRIHFDSRIEMLFPAWLKFRDLEITGADSIMEHEDHCVDIVEYLMNGNCALGFLALYKGVTWFNIYNSGK